MPDGRTGAPGGGPGDVAGQAGEATAGTEIVTVRAPGARLSVRVAGPRAGPVLVLLHGFPLNGSVWDDQLAALSDRWLVIVPDLRGHGRSEAGDGQYTIDFMVDDLFTVLDEIVPPARAAGRHVPVVAGGLSMGGYVVLRAVEREPERFRALVLANTRSAADTDHTRFKRFDAVRAVRERGLGRYAEMFVKTSLGETTRRERPDVVGAVERIVLASDPRGLVGAQLAMACRTDTTEALELLRMPTLVIAGEQDMITPADDAREMATRIAGARLVIIPRAGHTTALEAPGEFTRALEGFLDGLL